MEKDGISHASKMLRVTFNMMLPPPCFIVVMVVSGWDAEQS